MKQTAVEYLVGEFKQKLMGENLPDWVIKIIEQAKAMEKEQMREMYEHAMVALLDTGHGDGFDEYYNETFKSE